ncbi:alkaline phosphatase [Bacillus sp. 03113]|uniref:alkaline phosphatase n=1 Tax=Bacillus sp. 03113 TaxID=2578211 RepID=UPI00215C92D0|nr:alkaline phosphatase [Bacillus sp. 03113]
MKVLKFCGILICIITLYGAANIEADSFSEWSAFTYNGNQDVRNTSGTTQQKKPKNVIIMIGDGMGAGQMEIARLFEHGKEGRLFIESLPYTAFVHTYSYNRIVTDSAAAGTALATGHKTNNGMIGVTPDGEEVESLLDLFKKNEKKTGIVTTNSVTDATPAAFTASVKNRWSDQRAIAKQLLSNQVDVILGGGRQKFIQKNENGEMLIDQFKKDRYAYVANQDELKQSKEKKLLGLFNSGHLSFKIDREELKSREPSLTDMSEKAIEALSKDNEKGFFLMIEGARIDHASHAADLTSVWKETIEFDHAVEKVVQWANRMDDTLVLVLADHETMGISASDAMNIEALKNIQVSPHFMGKLLKKQGTFDRAEIKHIFKTYANIDLTNHEVEAFQAHLKMKGHSGYSKQHISWEIGSLIAEHYHAGLLNRHSRALSGTGGHTANMIPLFATGQGAERFHGVLDNTEVPAYIAELMGYKL